MKTFVLHWHDGEKQEVQGISVADAIRRSAFNDAKVVGREVAWKAHPFDRRYFVRETFLILGN